MATIKDILARSISTTHEQIFKATAGKIGGNVAGMPALILATTGRKSGLVRRTMLTAPIVDGDTVVLVASYGGDNRHPAWFLNLRENPEVEVTMRGATRRMTARVASEEQKAELWPRITKKYPGYAAYQRRTDRDIPVVVLGP
jgi:deazaflavin-dependent oxidoreductase (nitroreductase family)